MAEGTIEERVKQIIVDELSVDEAEVTANARFIDDPGAEFEPGQGAALLVKVLG